MLKTRVIGIVLVRGGIAVQSIRFAAYLPIGAPEIALKYLDRWGIDEIVVLHLDGWRSSRCASVDEVQSYARQGQVPLSVGGGIRTPDDVKRIIQAGADKVVINTAIVSRPALITEAAALFGNQCIVAAIDARRRDDGEFEAFVESGRRSAGMTAVAMAKQAAALGAGEILLTSIDRDGSKRGYDLDLIRSVTQNVSVPVIACGGARHPRHLAEAIQNGADAVAAGNFFHFTEHSVTVAKCQLKSGGSRLRLDSYVTYDGFRFGGDGRIRKLDDDHLDRLRFRYIPEEKI